MVECWVSALGFSMRDLPECLANLWLQPLNADIIFLISFFNYDNRCVVLVYWYVAVAISLMVAVSRTFLGWFCA